MKLANRALLLILIGIAALVHAGEALTATDTRFEGGEPDPPSATPYTHDEFLRTFAAATPKQRTKLLGSHFASDGPNRGAELMGAATPALRNTLLEATAQLVPHVLDRPIPRSMEDNHILVNCAGLLRAASDDNATLAAFAGNLDKLDTWVVEHYAIEALASCRDSRAVEVMAALATTRIRESAEWLAELSPSASEEQRTAGIGKVTSLFSATRGLAMSANSSAKAIASRYREEFIRLFDGHPYREALLRDIEAELDPLLPGTPPKLSPRSHAPLWLGCVAVAAALCFLGLLLWFRAKKYRGRANPNSSATLDCRPETNQQPQIGDGNHESDEDPKAQPKSRASHDPTNRAGALRATPFDSVPRVHRGHIQRMESFGHSDEAGERRSLGDRTGPAAGHLRILFRGG